MFECPFIVGMRATPKDSKPWLADPNTWGAIWRLFWQVKPEFGVVYLIEGMIGKGNRVGLRLVGCGGWYDAMDFRPLAEPDISVFETLLADINAGKVKPVVVPA